MIYLFTKQKQALNYHTDKEFAENVLKLGEPLAR